MLFRSVYFAVLLAIRFAVVQHDTGSIAEAIAATTWAAAFFALGLGLLWLLADLTARTTVYTITNRRVVMRIEKGDVESGATSVVIAELAQELIAQSHALMDAEHAPAKN